jgi:hypothetical protein
MLRSKRSLLGWRKRHLCLRRFRSSIAQPTRASHFLVSIFFYALTWLFVSYVFSALGSRFGWSHWVNKPFSLGETIVPGIVWGVAMVASKHWLFREERPSKKLTP